MSPSSPLHGTGQRPPVLQYHAHRRPRPYQTLGPTVRSSIVILLLVVLFVAGGTVLFLGPLLWFTRPGGW